MHFMPALVLQLYESNSKIQYTILCAQKNRTKIYTSAVAICYLHSSSSSNDNISTTTEKQQNICCKQIFFKLKNIFIAFAFCTETARRSVTEHLGHEFWYFCRREIWENVETVQNIKMIEIMIGELTPWTPFTIIDAHILHFEYVQGYFTDFGRFSHNKRYDHHMFIDSKILFSMDKMRHLKLYLQQYHLDDFSKRMITILISKNECVSSRWHFACKL